jgi:hypothetical protein
VALSLTLSERTLWTEETCVVRVMLLVMKRVGSMIDEKEESIALRSDCVTDL